MNIDLMRSAEQFHNRHRRNRVFRRLVSVLACVVVFCTTYALILPAITMERETVCGLAEHQHSESCHTQQELRNLVCNTGRLGVHTHTSACSDGSCGYADFALHTHDGSCYEGGKLVCTLPEVKSHTHSEDCYYTPSWEEPGHTHTEQCYTMVKGALSCGKAETEGHAHSEACYGSNQVLSCTTPESDGHHHGEGCNDEEGALVCELEESDGHHHGEGCYQTETVLICGQTEAEPHHHTDGCYAWEKTLVCGEQEGPMIRHGQPELVCGLLEIQAHRHTSACFDGAGSWICGQREVLTHTHTDACFETVTEDVLTCGMQEHTHTEDCYPSAETTVETTEATTAETTEAATEGTTEPDAGETLADELVAMTNVVPLDGDGGETTDTVASLPNVSIAGTGTEYDPGADNFKSTIKIDYTFTDDNKIVAGTIYTFNYPEHVVIPSEEVKKGKQNLYDDNVYAGTYQFIDNGDGTYSVQIIFNSTYAANHNSGDVPGYVAFTGTLDMDAMQKDGSIYATNGTNALVIPANKIKYPENANTQYDISTGKEGTLTQNGTQLTYTVYIDTTKGTPGEISFSDGLSNTAGLELGAPIDVKVVRGERYIDNGGGFWRNGSSETEVTVEGLNTTLSQLTVRPNPDKQNETIAQYYKITYTYPINDQTLSSVKPKNTATASSSDSAGGNTVTSSANKEITVSKNVDYTVDKTGSLEGGRIKWTVVINANQMNLVDATLTDVMLKDAQDVQIVPESGFSRDETTGTITFSEFAEGTGKNKNQYTITYYTPVTPTWDGEKVENTATLTPKDKEPVSDPASVEISGVSMSKSGAATGSGIVWTITVENPNGVDLAGTVLTDSMLENLKDGSLTIEPSDGISYDSDSHRLVFSQINEVANTTRTYIIQYSTTHEEVSQATQVTNRAVLKPTEGKPLEIEAPVTLQPLSIEKNGSYDGENGVIHWTVTVNPSGYNIAGAVLTDSLLPTATNISVTRGGEAAPSTEYTIGENHSVTFRPIAEGVNTYTYQVTYDTPAQQKWTSYDVPNHAVLTLDGKTVETDKSVTVPGDGSVQKAAGAMTQSGTTGTIPWTVTLTIPSGGLTAETTIADDVTHQYSDQWMTRAQILDWGGVMAWNDAAATSVNVSDQLSFTAADGTKYTYSQIAAATDLDEKHFTSFTIELTQDVPQPEGATQLAFTYSTTANLSDLGIGSNRTFHNRVTVGDKAAEAQYQYVHTGVVKYDSQWHTGETTITSQSDEIKWYLKAYVGESGKKKLTLVDTLPAGVTLSKLDIKCVGNNTGSWGVQPGEDGSITAENDYFKVSGSYTPSEGENAGYTVTLNITMKDGSDLPRNSEFEVGVTCAAGETLKDKQEHSLQNTVKMFLDDTKVNEASQTQKWTYTDSTQTISDVGKLAVWDNANGKLEYQVVLNPEGKDLLEDPEATLSLTDVLKYYRYVNVYYPIQAQFEIKASLVQSSVKLSRAVVQSDGTLQTVQDNQGNTKYVTGSEVTEFSWQYTVKPEGTENHNKDNMLNTITGSNVPDGVPLILSYTYNVTTTASDYTGDKSDLNFTLPFSNTVSLTGLNMSASHHSSSFKWSYSSSSAGITGGKSYTFYKVDQNNNGTSLPGAVFSVYQYNTADGTWGTTPVKTYTTTDPAGSFKISFEEKDSAGNVTFPYQTNTLYKVKETAAPRGYKLPKPVPEYPFYFSNTGDTEHTLPSDTVLAGAIDLSSETGTEYVGNESNLTQVSVQKVWKNSAGEDITATHSGGSVTINLYRKSAQGGGSVGGNVNVTVSVLKQGYNKVPACEQERQIVCRSGTAFTLTINSWMKPLLLINDQEVEPVNTSEGFSGSTNYVYQFEVTANTVLSGYAYNDNNASVTYVYVEPPVTPGSGETASEPADELVETKTITASDRWSCTFTNLPLTGTDEESGETVNYYYYISEVSVPNFTTGYENNAGIQSGTITVTNTAVSNPSYELPKTGGAGTAGYTLGGFTLTLGAALWLLYRRKRGREAV